jgi:hypothetical protein
MLHANLLNNKSFLEKFIKLSERLLKSGLFKCESKIPVDIFRDKRHLKSSR